MKVFATYLPTYPVPFQQNTHKCQWCRSISAKIGNILPVWIRIRNNLTGRIRIRYMLTRTGPV